MQPAGTAERKQRELSRVMTALNRDSPQGALHVCIHHHKHSLRGFDRTYLPLRSFTQVSCQMRQRLMRPPFVELEFSAQQPTPAKMAQDGMGVGDRRQQRSPIAGGARISTCGLGTDPQ